MTCWETGCRVCARSLSELVVCLSGLAVWLLACGSTVKLGAQVPDAGAVAPTTTNGSLSAGVAGPVAYDMDSIYDSFFMSPAARQETVRSSLAVTSGYDTSVNNVPGEGSAFSTVQGLVEVHLQQRRSVVVLAHEARIVEHPGFDSGVQQFQHTNLSAAGLFSVRTKWSAELDNGYGNDSARFTGVSQANSPASSVPQEGGAVALSQGRTLADFGSFRLEHQLTRSLTGEVEGSEFYHYFFQLGSAGQQQDVSVSLREVLSRSLDVGVSLGGTRETYLEVNCLIGTARISATQELARGTTLHASFGPALASSECTGHYVADVLFSRQTSLRSTVYAGAARKPSDQFAAGSEWQTSVFGGVSMGSRRGFQNSLDFGFSNYVVPVPTPSTPSLQGFFFAGESRRRVSQFAEVAVTGRYLIQNSAQQRQTRALVALSLVWSRSERPSHRISYGGRHGEY